MDRRHLLGLGAAGAFAPVIARAQQASAWPSQPARMVVPFAAGGPTDIPARLLADEMSKTLPNRVIVENRTGSGVLIGTDVVAKAPKDGLTMLYTTVGHAYLPGLFEHLPFDPLADFIPCAFIGQIPMILMVNKDFPARTLPELIALLRANPGKYDYASSGNGGAVHLGTELFLHSAGGLRVNHIAFRGSSAATPEVLAGRIPMIFDVASGALPYIRRGELRPLAISTRTRMPYAPDVPTFIEGGVPNFECYTWHMAMLPAGSPRSAVLAINAAFNRALAVPAVQERLVQMTMNVVTDSTPESAADFLRSETAKWTPVIRGAGIRPS